jgi:rRNA maturation protein Nop10
MKIQTLQQMRHCPTCGRQTLHLDQHASCNHILHLILSLVTCGLWLPVWFFIAKAARDANRESTPRCTVCGHAIEVMDPALLRIFTWVMPPVVVLIVLLVIVLNAPHPDKSVKSTEVRRATLVVEPR